MSDSISNPDIVLDPSQNGFSAANNFGGDVAPIKSNIRPIENYDDTIRRILVSYDIGHKLRQLRLRKKIALVDLGRHTGLSASMLSQLENGKLIPTLPTLARISMVFDVGLEFFFGDKRPQKVFSIVRAGERMRFPEPSDQPVPGYFFEVLTYGTVEKNMSAYLADFPRVASSESREHSHDGSEFIHVLSGRVGITYGSEQHILEAGDSVYFDSSEPHCYHGEADETSRALVVTCPPKD